MNFLTPARAVLLARPLLSFALLTVGLGEALIWAASLLPTELHYLLPWVVRALTIFGSLAGLALIRAACLRQRDATFQDLQRLHEDDAARRASVHGATATD